MVSLGLSAHAGRFALLSLLALLVPSPAGGQTISTVAGTQTIGDGGPATSASLRVPIGAAFDAAGNLYIVETFNHQIRRVAPDGTISRFAGNGTSGWSGDGGPATSAQIDRPLGVATDAAGNVYISDTNNCRIRKVSGGVISTIAGSGVCGFGGDGGPATAALLAGVYGIAVGPDGSVYFGDRGNLRVRKVTIGGIISTVAGTGVKAFSGDGAPATLASLGDAAGVALDAAGNLFIADSENHRIRRVDAATGIMTTVAGTGVSGAGADEVQALASNLITPYGVAVDAAGVLHLSDYSQRIRFVTGDGVIHTKAGSSVIGFSGDGGPATSAKLQYPEGFAFDAAGQLFIGDSGNDRIRRVTLGGTISTVAGSATDYNATGAATDVLLGGPKNVAIDSLGNTYIVDNISHNVRKVTPPGPGGLVISTFAGTGVAGFSGDGGAATAAQFNTPEGIAIDASDNVYVADRLNNRIRRITPGGIISTVAGTGAGAYNGDAIAATAANIARPVAVAVDAAGDVYVADRNNHRIRKFTPGGNISTVAGNGTAGSLGDGGSATSASLFQPNGVAVDAAGRVYIDDRGNKRVRKVEGGVISNLAGTGTFGFSGDGGDATAAKLYSPGGVAVDAGGNVYIADTFNARLRQVATDGKIRTVAGTGVNGFDDAGGNPTLARLSFGLNGVSLDPRGNLLLSDTNNYRVRKVFNALSITDATIAEGDSGTRLLNFSVRLAQASSLPVNFSVGTKPGLGSATAGTDYVAVGPTGRVLAPGQTSATFSVTINSDVTVEADETLVAELTGITGADAGVTTATGTIANDDLSVLSVTDNAVAEGNAGSKQLDFTVSLSKPLDSTVAVDLYTDNGLAFPGSDFIGNSALGVQFTPGQTSKSFSVSILGDTNIEGHETFTVNAANLVGTGVSLGDPQGQGRIINDDAAGLYITDNIVGEGTDYPHTSTFYVRLSHPMPNPVTFDISTSNGSASSSTDYGQVSQVGRFIDAGRTYLTFTVQIVPDALFEPDETFTVNITNVVGAALVDGVAVGTIANDDPAPAAPAAPAAMRVRSPPLRVRSAECPPGRTKGKSGDCVPEGSLRR